MSVQTGRLPSDAVRVMFDDEDRIASVFFDPLTVKPDPILETNARELLAAFMGGELEIVSRNFDATMHAQLPPAKLAELRRQTIELFGTFRSVTQVRQRNETRYRILDLVTEWEKSKVVVSVTFDRNARVSGLRIGPQSE